MTFTSLGNIARTFKCVMNIFLRRLSFVFCYLNDVLIPVHNMKEYYIGEVFNRLKPNGIITNQEKFSFG